jgi:EmrB/QacA subfamily drug resistance transporter
MALRLSTAAGRWALLATVLGTAMAFLDSTVVTIALPTIGRDLNASLGDLQWTVTGYTLALAGLILLGGALGDRYGRRRVFLIGVVWFAIASLLCAAAPSIGLLIAARVLQGAGGALLTPGSLALIQASFDPADRSRAVGAWSGLGGVASAIGPFLGGWLIQGPGWRWAFVINAPLALLVVIVALRHVPESRDESATGRFDIAGALLGAGALTGITYALIAFSDNAFAAAVAGVAGVAAGVAFVLVERRQSQPMLPLSIFASRQFSAVNVVTLVVYAALGGIFFLLSLQLQISAGFSPIAAGAALLPVTILMLTLSSRSGALAQRVGPRWPMTIGLLVAATGILLMTRIGPGSSYVEDVLPAATLLGLGMSFVVAPLTATVLATADPRRAGIASGVNNAVARAAQLLSVAGLPLLVGLSDVDYQSPAAFTHGFARAMVVCAGGMLAGSALSFVSIRSDALGPPEPVPAQPRFCGAEGAPLRPPLEPSDR